MLKKVLPEELLSNASLYTFFNFLEKGIPFLLLPILTRYLTNADYGIVAMFLVLIGLVEPLTSLGIPSAIMRVYYRKSELNLPAYISTTISLFACSTFFILCVLVLFSDVISSYSEFPEDWLFSLIIIASGQFFINVILVLWQAEFKAFRFGIFKIILSVLNFGTSIFLIVGLGYSWDGRVLGQVYSVSILGLASIFLLWKEGQIIFSFVKEYFLHALNFGFPLLPHMLSAILLTTIDRIFITNMVGISETGIYTVGYQIGMIIGVLATAFNKAWTPWFFKQMNKEDDLINRKIVKIIYGYSIILVLVAALLSLLAPYFMKYFVGEDFYGSTTFIFWIAIGFSFKGIYYMGVNYIFYSEKTLILSIITIIILIINIILNYYFINWYGAIGAAQATTLTYLIQLMLISIIVIKKFNMPWLSPFKM